MPNRISTVLVTLLFLVAFAAGTRSASAHDPTPRRATLATFGGYWWGHARGLRITSTGRASEQINSNCCTHAVRYTFQLAQARGTVAHASVAFRVTSVQIWKRSWVTQGNPRPRVGQRGELRLNHGVIVDRLTGFNYCNRTAANAGKCGV
jgi:hypothetical protein